MLMYFWDFNQYNHSVRFCIGLPENEQLFELCIPAIDLMLISIGYEAITDMLPTLLLIKTHQVGI
jgi:hypothetical protein